MPSTHVVVECPVNNSPRAVQLSGMFDVPRSEKARREWNVVLPIEELAWNVGLIVGPSGSGKTVIARHIWPDAIGDTFNWGAPSVVDDFDHSLSVEDISKACSSVGFNTIPAWLRPFRVLSNGEQFRVSIARTLLESKRDPVVVDEFTSVVDRQTAKFASHSVQKFVRKHGRRLIAVTCHYDVIDWLQPDWIYDVATRQFTRRLLQQRPEIECVVGRVPYASWELFAAFHYMTATLHKAARCFGLWCNGTLAAFAGVLARPHPKRKDIVGVSRLVTLPDYQGLGLAFALCDALGAAYRSIGKELRTYPAHPSLIRSFDRSTKWSLKKRPAMKSIIPGSNRPDTGRYKFGGRPNAVFAYIGPSMEKGASKKMLDYSPPKERHA